MDLQGIGWNEHFAGLFRGHAGNGLAPARVARQDKGGYLIHAEEGEFLAEPSGRLLHVSTSQGALPAVGDWVAASLRPGEGRATIHAVLPRSSRFSRKEAGGKTQQQVVAANVDTVFLVSALDFDFNVRRIERYLTMAWNSGAQPVVVLNKADLCDNVEERVDEVQQAAIGVSVLPVSAANGTGLEQLRGHVLAGMTVALLGMSGVGKSTIINALLGEQRLKTQDVREDDSRGRHTTTHRELIPLPGGGVLIDTPGMRELQLWADGDGLSGTFEDIEALAVQCRFNDCSHQSEPGCAVQQAIHNGELDEKRLKSFFKLQREMVYMEARQERRTEQLEKKRWKDIRQFARRLNKERDKRWNG